MKNTNWKLLLIISIGIIAVIFMGIFWVQGFQNKAIDRAEYLVRKEQAYAKGVKKEDGDTND